MILTPNMSQLSQKKSSVYITGNRGPENEPLGLFICSLFLCLLVVCVSTYSFNCSFCARLFSLCGHCSIKKGEINQTNRFIRGYRLHLIVYQTKKIVLTHLFRQQRGCVQSTYKLKERVCADSGTKAVHTQCKLSFTWDVLATQSVSCAVSELCRRTVSVSCVSAHTEGMCADIRSKISAHIAV